MRVAAPKTAVDRLLADVPRVAALVPGVDGVRALGGDGYEGTVRVTMGPMSFTFAGKATVVYEAAAGRWRLKAQAADRRVGGAVNVTMDVTATEPQAGLTALAVVADVTLLGRIGELGQPLIRRKAATIIEEFARNLQSAAQQTSPGAGMTRTGTGTGAGM